MYKKKLSNITLILVKFIFLLMSIGFGEYWGNTFIS